MIVISPTGDVLLLHRVQTSSAFPSAHVFPGGNLSATQDGEFLSSNDPKSHEDAPCYRHAAVRELFEESGILLAKSPSSEKLLVIDEDKRDAGRKAIHMNDVTFRQWIKSHDSKAEPDIG